MSSSKHFTAMLRKKLKIKSNWAQLRAKFVVFSLRPKVTSSLLQDNIYDTLTLFSNLNVTLLTFFTIVPYPQGNTLVRTPIFFKISYSKDQQSDYETIFAPWNLTIFTSDCMQDVSFLSLHTMHTIHPWVSYHTHFDTPIWIHTFISQMHILICHFLSYFPSHLLKGTNSLKKTSEIAHV